MNHKPLTIYLAGKVRDFDWRCGIVDYDRIEIATQDPESALNSNGVMERAILGTHHYSGPFPSIAYGHGQFDWERGSFVKQKSIVQMCLKQIEKSDLVFVWGDAESIYGTLVEVGYAVALGKTVYLATPIELPDHWFASLLPGTTGWHYHATAESALAAAIEPLVSIDHRPKLTNPLNKFVYLFKVNDDHYKIGVSSSVSDRVKQLQTANPQPIEIIHYVETRDFLGLESRLHQEMANQRTSGEWFRLATSDVRAVCKLMDSWEADRKNVTTIYAAMPARPTLRDRVRGVHP